MTIRDDDIRRQLRLGEDSTWEFKQIAFKGNRPVGPKRDDLADEPGTLANAEGGILLCRMTQQSGRLLRETAAVPWGLPLRTGVLEAGVFDG